MRRHILILLGIDPEEGSAAIDTRTGEEMAQFRILARIRERPIFGQRRILWITRADQSPEIDPVEIQGKNGKSVTTVVLEAPEKTVATWSKQIPAYSLALPSKASDREAWIRFLADRHHLALDRGAIEPLMTTFEGSPGPVDRLFSDLSREGEIRKVTEELLEKHGVVSHYKTVFDLLRGLENGDKKFFREWARFLEGGQSPFGLISLLHRQWKLYRIAKNALTEGRGQREAEQEVANLGGVPPFVAGSIARSAGKMSRESIRKGADALWEADLLLKSGVASALVMDRLAATLYALGQPGGRVRETEKKELGAQPSRKA